MEQCVGKCIQSAKQQQRQKNVNFCRGSRPGDTFFLYSLFTFKSFIFLFVFFTRAPWKQTPKLQNMTKREGNQLLYNFCSFILVFKLSSWFLFYIQFFFIHSIRLFFFFSIQTLVILIWIPHRFGHIFIQVVYKCHFQMQNHWISGTKYNSKCVNWKTHTFRKFSLKARFCEHFKCVGKMVY